MILVDTHCHLYLEKDIKALSGQLDRAEEAGVRVILLPAISLGSLKEMEALGAIASESHPGIRLYKMAGIHPCEVAAGSTCPEQTLLDLCSAEDVIAVGETGLDGYWSREAMSEQADHLRIHCRIAKELGKPIVLHNRETTADLLDLIESEQDGSLRGVWHCFNGSADEGKRALDLGLHLGIGGVLTYRNSGVDASVAGLPLDRMVLETDAPYLAPVPHRGKRNEPAFMVHTASRLAEIHGCSLADIAGITSRIACRLFGLPIPA
jgi:TatD DNase family protein